MTGRVIIVLATLATTAAQDIRAPVVLPNRRLRPRVVVSQYGPPIQITKAGTYSGNWQSLDPNVPAVLVTTGEPVIIENCNISSAGDAIQSYNFAANVTVRHCSGQALNPNVVGVPKGFFVVGLNFVSLALEHNRIEGFRNAVNAVNLRDDAETRTGQTLVVRYNLVYDQDGRLSDGRGGFLAGDPGDGTAAWTASVLAYFVRNANIEIAWNEFVNLPHRSQPEDVISTAESRGLPVNPIHIHDNFIQGVNPPDVLTFHKFSGCGIQLGDSPSKGDVGYTHVHDNQIVNFSSCGLSISSGHDNDVHDNRVISAPTLPDGAILNNDWKVGIQMNDYYWDPNYTGQPIADPYWHDNSMHDNASSAVFHPGDVTYNIFLHLGPTVTQTNNFDPLGRQATTADEEAEYASWTQKLVRHGISLGP